MNGKVTVSDVQRLIEDVRALETKIEGMQTTNRRVVEIDKPIWTGIHVGIGFILAPAVLSLFVLLLFLLLAVFGWAY